VDILTINAGSSSIKFALFEGTVEPTWILKGHIEGIATSGAAISVRSSSDSDNFFRPVTAPDFPEAVAIAMAWIGERGWNEKRGVVVHRIVHGGPDYHQPKLLDPKDVAALRRLVPLDPEHLPGALLLMDAITLRYPRTRQFACFDTGFHHDMPRVAQLLPIPFKYHAQGVRRYGFHGLSYEFLMSELRRTAGDAAAGGRIVMAHLGNGSSLAAVVNGQCIDTSMGFTPAAGIPMGTRTGDIDPGLALYLAQTENMDARQFNDFVNFKCGLLGLSGKTSDMRELLRIGRDDPSAQDAIALYCYQIRKWIGAYAAALGGLDTLIFTGGIGANAPAVRARICTGLDFLGIEMDEARNSVNAGIASSDSARVTVRVIQTDEELVMARAAMRLLSGFPEKT
jgi:acetate kinase